MVAAAKKYGMPERCDYNDRLNGFFFFFCRTRPLAAGCGLAAEQWRIYVASALLYTVQLCMYIYGSGFLRQRAANFEFIAGAPKYIPIRAFVYRRRGHESV